MSEAARTDSDIQLLLEHDRRLRDLERRQLAIEGRFARPEQWHFVGDPGEPAYTASWAKYALNPARFFKDGEGFVYVAGEAIFSTPPGGSVVFVLPVGYRPLHETRFPIAQVGAGAVWISLYVNGDVSLDFGGSNGFRYRLDCPPFRTI